MSTEYDLDLIEKLEKAATPGEWEGLRKESHGTSMSSELVGIAFFGCNSSYGSEGSYSISPDEAAANADLSAALRNAAPAMIRDLRDVPRLKEEHAKMREALEFYGAWVNMLVDGEGGWETTPWQRDGGRIARRVLAELKGEKS